MISTCLASDEERRRPLPADALVTRPLATFTHAITIRTSTRCVWPWIAQMGAGRGGWYGYDFLDNGGRPSAEVILPHFQEIKPGDVLPAVPGATNAFRIGAVEPYRDLVLTVSAVDAGALMTWELILRPSTRGRTRLVSRVRLAEAWPDRAREALRAGRAPLLAALYRALPRIPDPLRLPLLMLGNRIVQARMLRGIKRRAERALEMARSTAPARRPLVERLLPRAAVVELREHPDPAGCPRARVSGHFPATRRRAS